MDVILTNCVSRLLGDVVDGGGRARAGVPVLVFPTERDRWYDGSRYLARVVSDNAGAFAIAGLPFGTYYVVTGQSSLEGVNTWQDPAFLESLVLSSLTTTITEGQSRAVRLQLPSC